MVVDTKGTVIISAFPGCGKTWCYNNVKKYKMLDSDSSYFSWLYNENKQKTDVRNPEFPGNYIKHIKENFGKCDIIFVSSHKEVRDALKAESIPYVLVFPENTMENELFYMEGYRARGSTPKFCAFIRENWSNFIDEMKMEEWPVQYILGSYQEPSKKNLYAVLDDIVEVNRDYTNTEEN